MSNKQTRCCVQSLAQWGTQLLCPLCDLAHGDKDWSGTSVLQPCLTTLTPTTQQALWSCPFPAGQWCPASVLRPEIVSSFYFGYIIRMQLDPFLKANILYTDTKICLILFFILQQHSKAIVLGTYYIKYWDCLVWPFLHCVVVTEKSLVRLVSSHHPGSQTSQSWLPRSWCQFSRQLEDS